MRVAEITQTVTHYLANNYDTLRGAMPDEKYFLVQGATIGERERAESRIARGTAIDILADTIERKQFFGWFVPESIDQVANSGNAKIIPLNDGDKINGEFKVKFTKNGLLIAAEEVTRKKYIDILRTPEGFKQCAELLGIQKNVEGIAIIIYIFK